MGSEVSRYGIIEEMKRRFIHNADAYAIQWSSEKGSGYVKQTVGECTEGCAKYTCTHITDAPITDDAIRRHLDGAETMAIYQLAKDNTVKWACIDVDIRKSKEVLTDEQVQERERLAKEQTLAVAKTLYNNIGKKFVVENSGGRGYHIWIFFDPFVQARHALALLSYIDLQTPTVPEIAREIFPKQTSMMGYGNMVKMPLGRHRKTLNWCEFVDSTFTPYPDQETFLMNAPYMTEMELLKFIKQKDIEIAPSIRLEPRGDANKPGSTALPCQTRMMTEGLSEGCRDEGMFYVGCFFRSRGVPLDMAIQSMVQLNTRVTPPLDEDTIRSKAESAYARDVSPSPCYKPALDKFCSSSCRFWQSKLDERWTRFGRKDDAIGKISRD